MFELEGECVVRILFVVLFMCCVIMRILFDVLVMCFVC